MTIEEQIRRNLEKDIRSGTLSPGDRLPTEAEISARYGCARATVSKAMAALTADGLIERRKKAGSFVALPSVRTAVLEIPDIAALILGRGLSYDFIVQEQQVRPWQPDHGAEAPLDGGNGLLSIEGLHMAARAPFAIERRLISLAQVPDAATQDFRAISPGSWLLQKLPWTEARHRITACNASAAEADMLSLPRQAALLSVERWTWRSQAGVTFVRLLFPGNRYDLVSAFGPTTGKRA